MAAEFVLRLAWTKLLPSPLPCPRIPLTVRSVAQRVRWVTSGDCALHVWRVVRWDPVMGWLIDKPVPSGDEAQPVVIGWRITGLIGAGGMGRVYRAECDDDGRVGALKILDERWSSDAVIAARFEAEATALRQLEHEHIVRVLDTTESEDGRFCLVMEFVDGCDLGRLLRAEKLSHERALDIFGKVCAAVTHAHERGIVHRDIKPGNILIGRDGTVKLVDFGLAKDVTLDNTEHSIIGGLTSTTDQFGTAYYIAPERFVRTQSSGPQSDVYSLGVLLYHLLTGQMPLGNYTPLSVVTGLSAKWDRVLASALEADPEKRLATAQELDQAVAELWREHVQGGDRLRSRRRYIALGAAAVFLVTAAALGAWWQRERMKPKPVVFSSSAKASAEHPWENSLGMKFVPVPGTKVLFSIYEARRRDVQPFFDAYLGMFSAEWMKDRRDHLNDLLRRSMVSLDSDGQRTLASSWNDPGWPVTGDHAACYVGIRDAQMYCLWLTWKEQAEGRLTKGQRYRLPTDSEWLVACGGVDATLRPGNLAGPEARDDQWPKTSPTFADGDPFPRTAPVGSFPVEPNGLHDMSGNVSEWVVDRDENSADRFIESEGKLRGPHFGDGLVTTARFGFVRKPRLIQRMPFVGFRIVLESSEPQARSVPGS